MLFRSGLPQLINTLQGVLPQWCIDAVAQLSLLAHFDAISRGVLNVSDLLYYAWFIACWLTATVVVIEKKKSE